MTIADAAYPKSGHPTNPMADADKKYVWHPFTQMRDWTAPGHEPLVLVEGEGAVLRDINGREYIDGNSSIWTNIHGHRHPGITAAIKAQLDAVAHVSFLGSTNRPAIELATQLIAHVPGSGLARVFYSDDGSTAIEVALKMAIQYWQLVGNPARCRFAAFDAAYHGDTAGAASLGGVGAFFDRFAPVHFKVEHINSVDALRAMEPASVETLAAVVIEPIVQGVAGIRPWPTGMLADLRAWCDAHNVLLIFDEVLTGFGRTGTLFACEQENVWPDFLCLAKGLTGGMLPLAATLVTNTIYEAFLGEYEEMKTFFYGHSYCGNPLGCAAALANLAAFREEKTLAALAPKIDLLTDLMEPLARNPRVGEIRQCGFLAGIDLQEAPGVPFDWRAQTGARVCHAARAHGLLTRPIRDTVTLIPPLCITPDQLRAAVQAMEQAILETLQ
jgi:adenosylmethionine---8-amino-7-oxononanoate aminotransferase